MGYFNDLDMLMIGDIPNLSMSESKAHMALWSILKSPLLIGCNISSLN